MANADLIAKLQLTPIAAAAYSGDGEALEEFLSGGVDITLVAGTSSSYVLHWAKDLDTARTLLDAGADPNAQDATGKSVLYWRANEPDKSSLLSLFMERGADPRRACHRGVTPLHRAAETNVIDNATAFMKAGAFVDGVTNHDNMFPGRTPLHYAAKAGHAAMVRLLIDAGAEVNVQDRGRPDSDTEGGCTPLHLAAEKGRLDVIELLLERGARKDIYDNENRIASDTADWYDHPECRERLR